MLIPTTLSHRSLLMNMVVSLCDNAGEDLRRRLYMGGVSPCWHLYIDAAVRRRLMGGSQSYWGLRLIRRADALHEARLGG